MISRHVAEMCVRAGPRWTWPWTCGVSRLRESPVVCARGVVEIGETHRCEYSCITISERAQSQRDAVAADGRGPQI